MCILFYYLQTLEEQDDLIGAKFSEREVSCAIENLQQVGDRNFEEQDRSNCS